jgi:hypothetical protein
MFEVTIDHVECKVPLAFLGDRQEGLILNAAACPSCHRPILEAAVRIPNSGSGAAVIFGGGWVTSRETTLWPLGTGRPPVPTAVPANVKADYEEAAAVLPISPKASAALSRRILQDVLVNAGGAITRNLIDQIVEVMPSLPKILAEQVDAIRVIGNFSAHPKKSIATGEIVDVEPHEAEWNLEVLDLLFQHYYTSPAEIAARRAALQAKIATAGGGKLK